MVLHKNTTFRCGWINNMAASANSRFWLADFQKSSPTKLPGQIQPNFIGMMYGLSCTKYPFFSDQRNKMAAIGNYSDWPNSQYFFVENNGLIFTKLGRNDSWMVLSKNINLCSNWTRRWPQNGLFWLADFQNIFSSETAGPNLTKL